MVSTPLAHSFEDTCSNHTNQHGTDREALVRNFELGSHSGADKGQEFDVGSAAGVFFDTSPQCV